jgi:hypothetical protein
MLVEVAIQSRLRPIHVSGIESRYRRDDGHTGLTKMRILIPVNQTPVNQIPLSHDGLILTSDRASIAAVVSEAAVAINQGSVSV